MGVWRFIQHPLDTDQLTAKKIMVLILAPTAKTVNGKLILSLRLLLFSETEVVSLDYYSFANVLGRQQQPPVTEARGSI